MAGQSNPFTSITLSALLPLKVSIFTANIPPPDTDTDTIWGNTVTTTRVSDMSGGSVDLIL